MTRPVRLQLSRKKGFILQKHSFGVNGLPAVNVGRPSKWGNAWRIGEPEIPDAAEAVRRFRGAVIGFESEGCFCRPLAHPDSYIGKIIRDAPTELRGKNLACWCKLSEPCHADVLLELANGPAVEEAQP